MTEPSIRCRGLVVAPRLRSRPIDLEVHESSVVGLTGPSPSGKSRLIAAMAGWDAAAEGEVTWAGSAQPPGWRSLSVVSQGLAVLDELSVIENLSLPAWINRVRIDPDEMTRVTERLNVAHLLDRSIRGVSMGERQRIVVARALCHRPRIMLLDEPVAHLDRSNASTVLELVREFASGGGACVIASRDPRVVSEVADEIFSLDNVLPRPETRR